MTIHPRHCGPLLFAAIQSAVTTAVAAGIATIQLAGADRLISLQWGQSWLLSWLAMLPIVIGMAPMLQGVVVALTQAPDGDSRGASEHRRDAP